MAPNLVQARALRAAPRRGGEARRALRARALRRSRRPGSAPHAAASRRRFPDARDLGARWPLAALAVYVGLPLLLAAGAARVCAAGQRTAARRRRGARRRAGAPASLHRAVDGFFLVPAFCDLRARAGGRRSSRSASRARSPRRSARGGGLALAAALAAVAGLALAVAPQLAVLLRLPAGPDARGRGDFVRARGRRRRAPASGRSRRRRPARLRPLARAVEDPTRETRRRARARADEGRPLYAFYGHARAEPKALSRDARAPRRPGAFEPLARFDGIESRARLLALRSSRAGCRAASPARRAQVAALQRRVRDRLARPAGRSGARPWSFRSGACCPSRRSCSSIAILPLAAPHWWESNRNKGLVAALLRRAVRALALLAATARLGAPRAPREGAASTSRSSLLLGSLFVDLGRHLRARLARGHAARRTPRCSALGARARELRSARPARRCC